MRTEFTAEQLADPATAVSEGVIRKCVHCGFCTATCPTYVLLGDELDSPRGRIYLMKDMLEGDRTPSAETVKHVDRCLSCLACVSTCPSGVNYMHLVDHARAYIEARYRRPLADRTIRSLLAAVLPHRSRFRQAARMAGLMRPARNLIARVKPLRPLAAMLALAPRRLPQPPVATDACVPTPRGRVVMLQGCAEPVLRPEFRQAAVRLLNRAGFDVLFAPGEGCCGALVHHMGREADALSAARRNVDAWSGLIEAEGIDAILVTASGCGTMLKTYGFLLRDDPDHAAKAARVSALAEDICEFLAVRGLPATHGQHEEGLIVAYHAACSLQHGQKVANQPKRLLEQAGYVVRTPAEAHLCCGSAGVYNILQPEIAGRLGRRKADNLKDLDPDVIATGNIGCAVQLAHQPQTAVPVVHVVELLDWASGGPRPRNLSQSGATS